MGNDIDSILRRIEAIDREHGSQSKSTDSNKWVVSMIAEQCRLNYSMALTFAQFEGESHAIADSLNSSSRRIEVLTLLLIGFGFIQIMLTLPLIIASHDILTIFETGTFGVLFALLLFAIFMIRKW